MDRKKPIGIFDSGVGGLTVVKSVLEKLPRESFIYFGDTAHVPYGNKTEEQLFSYARQILAFLVQRHVKAVIVACGTHSSVTLPSLEKDCTLPILGVVKAGARSAIRTTGNGRIGVLATQATVNSKAYTKTIKEMNGRCEVFEMACPRLVPLVESGQLDGPEIRDAVEEYVGPLMAKGIDALILGCTHYPFLAGVIEEYINPGVNLIDPSDETTHQLVDLLDGKGLLNDSPDGAVHEFYVSGQNESFFKVGKLLIGESIGDVARIDLY